MASHLGTFHLLFMQWLLFRLSSAFLQPNSNHIKSVDASAETGEWESLCFRKLISPAPTHFISPKKEKAESVGESTCQFQLSFAILLRLFLRLQTIFLAFFIRRNSYFCLGHGFICCDGAKMGFTNIFYYGHNFSMLHSVSNLFGKERKNK